MDYIKKLLKSKTVWLGISQIITGVGMFFTGDQSVFELLFGASGVLVIIMRVITKMSIEDK